jgi:hypothetical protein
VLIYVANIAEKIARVERELHTLAELAEKRHT